MHWLDIYSKGQPALHNVATSSRSITKICPNLITYCGSRARPTLFELAALHAAARTRRVIVREGASITHHVRLADQGSRRAIEAAWHR